MTFVLTLVCDGDVVCDEDGVKQILTRTVPLLSHPLEFQVDEEPLAPRPDPPDPRIWKKQR